MLQLDSIWMIFFENRRICLTQELLYYSPYISSSTSFPESITVTFLPYMLWEKEVLLSNKAYYSNYWKIEKLFWRYGISRDGIPRTCGGNGTVRYTKIMTRYGTVRYDVDRRGIRYEMVPNFCNTVSLWLGELNELKGRSSKNETNKITKHFQKTTSTHF